MMRRSHVAIIVGLVLFMGTDLVSASPLVEEKLCDVLGSIAVGEQKRVTLKGVYAASYEQQVFFDPTTPSCAIDVQPVTWLEFSPSFKADDRFDQYISNDHRVQGTFTGVLWGPGEVQSDDPSAPMMIAYANRVANRRYGHMNAFRTRFVVESVQDVRAVARDLPSYGSWAARRPRSDIPRLLGGELPRYPPAAQNVGIAGTVVVAVTVTDGTVHTKDVRFGDRILADAVLATLSTWRFEPSVNAKFTSTFIFELKSEPTGADPNPAFDAKLPTFARISAPMNGW